MDKSQNDLEAIRHLLAELTARVYRIEQRLAMQPQAPLPTLTPVAPPQPTVSVAAQPDVLGQPGPVPSHSGGASSTPPPPQLHPLVAPQTSASVPRMRP